MKKITSIVVLVLTMALLTACGSKATTDNQTGGGASSTPEATSTPEANNDKVTVTHSKGTVSVDKGVTKAVVFDMAILDIMDSLKIDAKVAAPVSSIPSYVTSYSDAVNAGSIKEPDMEAIYEFAPEVIFISGRQSDFYDELSKIAPTIYVDLNAATYMEDVARNITTVGQIFNKEAEAKEAITSLETLANEVKAIAEAKEEKALIILSNEGSLSAYGKGSRFGLIHDALGVKTADETIAVSTHGQEASYEYISKINPDILYVVDRTAVVGGDTTKNEALNNELINSTKAAANDKIVYLDPECWYISGGGIHSVTTMINEVKASLQ